MEDFKLEIFARERPGRPLPKLRALTPQEAWRLRSAPGERAGLTADPGGRALRLALLGRARPVENAHAEEEGFDLVAVAASLGLEPREEVNVNWDDFTTIHRVRFADLAENFDYLWYPGPDGVDIFDESLSWVLSVDHGGYIRVWKPTAPDARPWGNRPAERSIGRNG